MNSTSDLPDASLIDPACEVAPIGSQKCTLRAAIEQAVYETKTECTPCTIQFDPSVFPKGPPGGPQTISIDKSGEGLLPAIEVPLTIDASDAGVIIEPDEAANAGTGMLDYGLAVIDDTPANPTDFRLIGNNFTIRGFEEGAINADAQGDGIVICGDSAAVAFTGAADSGGLPTYDPTADDCDQLGPVENIFIDPVTIALNGDDAIVADGDGVINFNADAVTIFGNGSGIVGHGIELDGGTGDVTGSVTNSSIHSADDAVNIDGEKCHFDVLNNPILVGLDDAFDADCGDNAILDISDNGNITAGDDDAIFAGVGVGSTININRNGKIVGGDDADGIDIDADTGLILNVLTNGHISGMDDGIAVAGGTGSSIAIEDNGPDGTIRGYDDHGIDLTSLGDGTDVRIINNFDIIAGDDDEGISVSGGDDITLLIDRNRDIIGGDDAIYVSTSDETIVDITNNRDIRDRYSYGVNFSVSDDGVFNIANNRNITAADDAIELSCSDGNTMYVRDNGDIVGFAEYGIYVSCGDETTVFVEDNGSALLAGESVAGIAYPSGSIIGGEYGIYCSCSDDTTFVVDNNGAIVGLETYGVYFSTSDNTDTTFTNNGDIIGGSYGFYYSTGDDLTAVIQDNGSIEGWDDSGIYCSCSDNIDFDVQRNGVNGSIEGGIYGIYFSVSDDVTAVFNDNGPIIGYEEYGSYCSCGDNHDWTFTNNGDIIGGEYGIYFGNGDGLDLTVEDNGNIEGWEYYGFYFSMGDDLDAQIHRNGLNGTIEGGEYGFYVSASDDMVIEASNNGDIIGYETTGVYCSCTDRMDFNFYENGDILGGEYGFDISTSDDTELRAVDNGNIIGYEETGVEVSSSTDTTVWLENNGSSGAPPAVAGVGFFPAGAIIGGDDGIYISCSDVLDLDVLGHGDIVGVEDDGIYVDCDDDVDVLIQNNNDIWGGADDEAVDLNVVDFSFLRILDNGHLMGGDDGVQIDTGVSANVEIENNGPDGSITGGDDDGVDASLGDDSEISIRNNGSISGGSNSDGIDIDSDDSIIAWIQDNGNIMGGESGIEIEGTTLEFYIDRNGNITGSSEDGIQVDDSRNGGPEDVDIVEGTIIDNGIINGHGGDGIRLIGANRAAAPVTDPARLQNVTISGNNIGNGSEDRGIYLECTAALDCIGFGIVVTDNVIQGNGEEGVLVMGDDGTSFTSNTIGPNNVITQNGGPGVKIEDSNDNTIIGNDITWNGGINTGVEIVAGAVGFAIENTISKNRMASNVGLGIDLGANGLAACPATGPNACIGTPPQPNVSGNTISGIIGPPNAIALCAFCTVEAFVTDNPPDPTGFGEGFHFIGRSQTDGTGEYNILVDKDLYCGGKAGSVTVTLTDTFGNTSEFSRNSAGFGGTNECPTDTPTVTETPLVTDTPTPPPATDTPTAAPPTATSTPTTGPVKVCGDADFDGAVTALDALHVLQFKAGFLSAVNNASNADVNGEDGISSIDAALILQRVAGLIPALTGCI